MKFLEERRVKRRRRKEWNENEERFLEERRVKRKRKEWNENEERFLEAE